MSITPNKKYNIFAHHSGKALDVYGNSKGQGTHLIQYAFHGQQNQQFIFESVGNGYYMIKCVHSGLYWDIYGNQHGNCVKLIQWSKHGQYNQQFRLDRRGNGIYAIIARHSNKAIDVESGSHNNHAKMIQFDFHGQTNQLFRIQLTAEEIKKQQEADRLKQLQEYKDKLAREYARKLKAERRVLLTARKNDLLSQKQHIITTELNQIQQKIIQINNQINNEEKEISNFVLERSDKSNKIIILIGKSGQGKSTFGDRLSGDTTPFANNGPFKTSGDNKGCTQSLQKYNHNKCCVIDAPGWDDPDGNDRTHTNNLCAYLKGSGGINAIVVVRNATQYRFDAIWQQKLKQLEFVFGNTFWKHLIIVLTHVDKGIAEMQFINNNKAKQMKDDISKLCNGLNNNVPVIPIGLDNYKDKLKIFMKAIPIQRFICDNIKSPIDELKNKKQRIIVQQNAIQQRIDTYTQQINDINGQINAL